MRVYLAGSITGATPKDAIEWRQYAKEKLSKYNIAAYSPLRGKETLSKILTGNTKIIEVDAERNLGGPENTSKAIMMRDYLDCIKSDALLVNLLTDTPDISGGTMMELGWAFHLKIPTVLVCPEDCYYTRHPMSHEATTYRVDTVDQGIQIIVSVLLP